jgi:dihydrofolate reductase
MLEMQDNKKGGFVRKMLKLTSIVAVSRNGAIGCQNQLPWRLRSDLKFFKSKTIGNVVVMGRKTHDSIGGCLPGRTNIVLSHNAVLFQSTEECQISLSIAEALVKASSFRGKEIFVVGGASTYEQFAPYVDRYLVTVVDKQVENADAFLPEGVFGNPNDWNISSIAKFEAQEGLDEAPFEIFEWMSKQPEAKAALRQQAMDNYLSKVVKNKKPVRKTSKTAGEAPIGQAFALQF